jgi:DNA-binding CsgD family transcriptional regulator
VRVVDRRKPYLDPDVGDGRPGAGRPSCGHRYLRVTEPWPLTKTCWASSVLLKDASHDQLATAIRTVSAGQALLAPPITRRLVEDFCRGPAPDGAAAETAQLSQRELDVVRQVAQGLSNAEIAGQLYLSEATVKSHIARILAKFGLRDRVQIVVFAYETGIIRPGRSGRAPDGKP